MQAITFTESVDFQTPIPVCNYMADLLPNNVQSVLEPTPGIGNLVHAIQNRSVIVYTPEGDFWNMKHDIKYDAVVMNPPFTPTSEGYRYLKVCMELSDRIVALLPWFIIINSERRLRDIKSFGLVSVTHLPRKTFPGARIQCCVLEMNRNFDGHTRFKNLDF
jgi:hypothetical protein